MAEDTAEVVASTLSAAASGDESDARWEASSPGSQMKRRIMGSLEKRDPTRDADVDVEHDTDEHDTEEHDTEVPDYE